EAPEGRGRAKPPFRASLLVSLSNARPCGPLRRAPLGLKRAAGLPPTGATPARPKVAPAGPQSPRGGRVSTLWTSRSPTREDYDRRHAGPAPAGAQLQRRAGAAAQERPAEVRPAGDARAGPVVPGRDGPVLTAGVRRRGAGRARAAAPAAARRDCVG